MCKKIVTTSDHRYWGRESVSPFSYRVSTRSVYFEGAIGFNLNEIAISLDVPLMVWTTGIVQPTDESWSLTGNRRCGNWEVMSFRVNLKTAYSSKRRRQFYPWVSLPVINQTRRVKNNLLTESGFEINNINYVGPERIYWPMYKRHYACDMDPTQVL